MKRAQFAKNVREKKGHWKSLSDIDGLSHNCRRLLEDADGNIWIGTRNGLCRYDGKSFINYTEKDGLANKYIRCILQDSERNIWIGTLHGLSLYRDNEGFTNFTSLNNPIFDDIRCIYQDKEGNIWFGTRLGLSRCDGKNLSNFNKHDGLIVNNIRCVYQDESGDIWLGTRKGLYIYNGAKFYSFPEQDGLADRIIYCIQQDKEGNIWIGTADGLSRFDGKSFANFTSENGLANNNINCLYRDRDGNIWIGTSGGVSYYTGSEFINFNTEDGLAYNNIHDIIQDREGNLWFACHHGGISIYSIHGFSGISDESVNEAMIKDRRGNFWWGADNVLTHYHGKEINHYPFKNAIQGILEDSKDRLWIGTEQEGLFRYENVHNIREQEPQELCLGYQLDDGKVMAIYEDRCGNIWIGTECGLMRYGDDGKITKFTTDDGLGSNYISVIFQDSKDICWFAGWEGGGITNYDGRNFHKYTRDDGLTSDEVTCITEDKIGDLWIGTHAGLLRSNGDSFLNYTTKDGLLGNHIKRIFQDSKGHLWIATLGGGLSRYDGKNFQVLTTEDVLPSNSITDIAEDSDGSMVISTYRGICRYKQECKIPPLIRIDEVDADRIYKNPEHINISEKTSLMQIKYHGISHRTTRIRYNYMLEGYDKDWIATWNEEVHYENLPAGKYIFKVIAINRDLVYSENPAELILDITHDPRNLVIAELEERVKERTAELQKKTEELSRSNEELNAFVYTVSHDLKAPVITLNGFSELLMEEYGNSLDKTARMYLRRIQRNSLHIQALINDLLELSRAGRVKGKEGLVNTSKIVTDVIMELEPQLKERGTKLVVKNRIPEIWCDALSLKQIFANLINNANKFMGHDNKSPTIELGYFSQENYHTFYVKDNGIGIEKEYHEKIFQIFQRLEDVEVEGTGVGLAIIKKIIKDLEGKIWVDSAKGKGSTFYFAVPKGETES